MEQFSVYYSKIFPIEKVGKYLALIYSPYSLDSVDFMITIQQQDQPSRYNSWDMVVKKLKRKDRAILRIDMGGLFKSKDIPVERFLIPVNDDIMRGKPLFFDVDDYETERVCCKKLKTSCKLCWRTHIIPCFEKIVFVLEATLPPSFNFDVFYSGGRGLHVHVRGSMLYAPLGFLEREGIVRGIFEAFSELKVAVRFDEEVSRQVKHCIRLPFSIHENTGRAALPLDRKLIKWNKQFPVGKDNRIPKDKEAIMNQYKSFMNLLKIYLTSYPDSRMTKEADVNMATEIVSSLFSLIH
jgi:hypothetical protein